MYQKCAGGGRSAGLFSERRLLRRIRGPVRSAGFPLAPRETVLAFDVAWT